MGQLLLGFLETQLAQLLLASQLIPGFLDYLDFLADQLLLDLQLLLGVLQQDLLILADQLDLEDLQQDLTVLAIQ